MGQMIVEDVMETWYYIFVGLLLAMILCLLIIAVMRWMATPLVWLSIIGVIGMLGFGESHFFKRFMNFRKCISRFSLNSHVLLLRKIRGVE